jgi:undecaprenyl pyrophosphate phosphatase UppP
VRIMQDKLILEIRIYTISICCTGLLALKWINQSFTDWSSRCVYCPHRSCGLLSTVIQILEQILKYDQDSGKCTPLFCFAFFHSCVFVYILFRLLYSSTYTHFIYLLIYVTFYLLVCSIVYLFSFLSSYMYYC